MSISLSGFTFSPNNRVPYTGWSPQQRSKITRVPLAINGGTGNLMGPANAGLVRFYDVVNVLPVTPGTFFTDIDCVLRPDDQIIANDLVGGADTGVFLNPPILFPGQFMRFTNNSVGAGMEALVLASYWDFPIQSYSNINIQLTDAFQDVIPAPAPGFLRFLTEHAYYKGESEKVGRLDLFCCNADTVSHVLEWAIDGLVIGRTESAAANEYFSFGKGPISGDITVENDSIADTPVGPLQVRMLEPVTTTGPYMLGSYLTVQK